MGHWRMPSPYLSWFETSLGTATDPVEGVLIELLPHKGLRQIKKETEPVAKILRSVWQDLWKDESGQDIAEYAVMLAVILVIVVGTVRLIGSNAKTVFSQVGSSIQ